MHLERLAERLVRNRSFLGFWLAQYAASLCLSDAEIAERLGCTVETLTLVRLCRAPILGTFIMDTAEISHRFGLNQKNLETMCIAIVL